MRLRFAVSIFLLPFAGFGELVWERTFESNNGLVDGPLSGQDGWVGSESWLVDLEGATLNLGEPFQELAQSEAVTLGVWDRARMVVKVRVDLSKDVNQTPLRFGFTATTDDDLPIPLPFGNSSFESTALAAELFRDGYPFFQTEGVDHHTGTLKFSPFFGAYDGVVSMTGGESGIYPHARLQVLTLVNGDADTRQSEIQYFAPIPIAEGPAFGAGDTYRLVYAGEETSDLLVTSSDSEVQAALEALPTVGAGNATVIGDFSKGFEVTFQGSLRHQDLVQLEVIEPTVQDHLTQTLELTYDLLKTTATKTFRVQVSARNLDTGAVFDAPAVALVDNFAHSRQNFYPSLRGGNFAGGGSLVLESVALYRESADADNDGDGFSNRVEFQAGSDHEDAAITPIEREVLLTDFSTSLNRPLDDSPDWFASDLWLTQATGGASLEVGTAQRALTEASVAVDPGKALLLSAEFRVSGEANFAIEEAALFEIGVTDQIDPSAGGFQFFTSLESKTAANGTLVLDQVELGGIGDFYEGAAYDADSDEAVIAGASRSSGPSDWIRIVLLLIKGEEEGAWTVKKQLIDLEGEHQGRWEMEKMAANMALWNASSVRGGFGSGVGLAPEVAGSFEVRSFQSRLLESGDYDADRLSNIDELFLGTDFGVLDTDGDLQADWFEVMQGSDPRDPESLITDTPLLTQSYAVDAWGVVRLEVTGLPGKRVLMEQSVDLENWTPYLAQPSTINLFGETRINEYFDPSANRELFFRVKEISE